MPLDKGPSKEAFSKNVSTLMHESYPQKQALAIAYSVKRRGRALGGPPAPWFTRYEARNMMHSGPIMSSVAGRTDHHNMDVAGGSYVLPADHVSSLGQGNTMSGMKVLNKMFSTGPYGTSGMGRLHGSSLPKPPKAPHKAGGKTDGVGKPVPIAAAGGEYVLHPVQILDWLKRNGYPPDLKFGHKLLDKWVVDNRKKHVNTLKKLPGPAKS